jgi:hypothetical protein
MILNLCKTEKSSCTSETTQKNEKQETQNKNKEGEREREATFLSCCKSLIVVYLIFCPQFEDLKLLLLLLLLLLPGHFYGTTTSWLSPSPPSSLSAHTWSCNLLQLALLFLADGTGVRVDWLIDWLMDGWFGPFLEIEMWPEYQVLWLQPTPTPTLHKQQSITNRANTFVAEQSHLLHKQARP